jgi:hypothetical protein
MINRRVALVTAEFPSRPNVAFPPQPTRADGFPSELKSLDGARSCTQ